MYSLNACLYAEIRLLNSVKRGLKSKFGLSHDKSVHNEIPNTCAEGTLFRVPGKNGGRRRSKKRTAKDRKKLAEFLAKVIAT